MFIMDSKLGLPCMVKGDTEEGKDDRIVLVAPEHSITCFDCTTGF